MRSFGRNGTVLIVEDNAEWAKALETAFLAKAFTVQSATRVADAQMRLGRQGFDCIILDLKLENSSGETVLDFISQPSHKFNRDTPVLIVSGVLDEQTVLRVRQKIAGILVKPLAAEQVVRKVCELLQVPA